MATPEEQAAAMIANMAEKTGKSLEAWLEIAKASNLSKHGEIVKMLKSDHAMTHGFANLVAHHALRAAEVSSDDLVSAQYAGGKEALRPIYDTLEAYVKTLGKDVEIAPKKTSVSIRRNKQFALIQPASRTRVDLGINLKGTAPTDRLEAWGGMISHRVRLQSTADVDSELKAWLKDAYQRGVK
ncbi:DUF4287 domain-containing protein [Kordiimonas sp.]|uniref:DUF4287 domain-containing protein n=1 Tax=Kordiimonas sp. TaxID=1970157 RepID=UPI003A93697A